MSSARPISIKQQKTKSSHLHYTKIQLNKLLSAKLGADANAIQYYIIYTSIL